MSNMNRPTPPPRVFQRPNNDDTSAMSDDEPEEIEHHHHTPSADLMHNTSPSPALLNIISPFTSPSPASLSHVASFTSPSSSSFIIHQPSPMHNSSPSLHSHPQPQPQQASAGTLLNILRQDISIDDESGDKHQEQFMREPTPVKQPIEVEFEDISFKVPGGRTALKKVSGKAKPGQILAVLGESGSGKSTFLDLIGGRTTSSTGRILFNGSELEPGTLKQVCQYVEQDPPLHPSSTVRETLEFYASLRLPLHMSQREKMERVDMVIEEMNLQACADSLVGSSGGSRTQNGKKGGKGGQGGDKEGKSLCGGGTKGVRGISGGERRKLCVCLETLVDPSILILDEPTSSLDSSSAFSLMQSLRRLADSGRTIIVTLHQPSSLILDLLDSMMILSSGRLVFSGAVHEAAPYFASLGYPCSPHVNIADHIMPLVARESRFRKLLVLSYENKLKKEQRLAQQLQRRQSVSGFDAASNSKYVLEPILSEESELTGWDKFSLFFLQVRCLMYRSFVDARRNPRGIQFMVFQSLFVNLLQGFVFFQLPWADASSVQSKLGVLSLACLAVAGVMSTVVYTLPEEAHLFMKDAAANVYSAIPYYIAKITFELPTMALLALIQSLTLYNMVNLREGYDYWSTFYFISFLTHCAASGMGFLLGSAAPSLSVAVALQPAVGTLMFLFSGNFANISIIPAALRWLSSVTPLRYAFEAFVVNEFGGVLLTCPSSTYSSPVTSSPTPVPTSSATPTPSATPRPTSTPTPNNGGGILDPLIPNLPIPILAVSESRAASASYCVPVTGESVITNLQFSPDAIPNCMAALILFVIFCHFAGMMTMYYKAHRDELSTKFKKLFSKAEEDEE